MQSENSSRSGNGLEWLYERERMTLCKYATFSEKSGARVKPISECDFRLPFQRDRDRIIHSKSFRRLMHKTQCFLSPEGDHYRTRLTHTLEVTQIARTIARALRLNEDLTEACALGHDLGHTPFGHAGERVLNRLYSGGFAHNEQSLRTVELLENGGRGLNLTEEVRDGIVCHTGNVESATLEGRIIKFADRIAYINHDIDDAVRGGVLSEDDIPKALTSVLGSSHGERIDTMVRSVIDASQKSFDEGFGMILMDGETNGAMNELRSFMFKEVYFNPKAKSEESKACVMIEQLYNHFVKNPDAMPEERRKYLVGTPVERVVCDYIAGMTDRYAISVFSSIFVPKTWGM